ncbi:MAG: bifunctional (p)ppGpp synthetase/guanosine-3',5'-bis(diphosphate) 3'-pyrophosphohydrolase [Candidatus Microthrix sp.]|nr:bifunctional (p)ppGpp synthetase/guanosine-3',5'-bis(diphosphate) 3'-pyrophosphohydrolase [Candidatus Microthrix sp.]
MPTVTRVLPWRRHSAPRASELRPLVLAMNEARDRPDIALVERAYDFAKAAHEGQLRASGEPYITHPLAVATIVARYGADDATVCAALLHDTVEDCDVTLAEISAKFGPTVSVLVDGCTKLDRVEVDSKAHQKAETIRKIILSMANDLRVIVIKLADRLHNLRTVAAMSPAHQEKQARETLDVYAPLAHRLGMTELRQQLEDLCFASLHPQVFAEIDHLVAQRAPERDLYLMQVIDEMRFRLERIGVDSDITGRPKHLWSLYEKMVIRGRSFDEIHDLMGVRIIVTDEADTYAALGAIHALWRPVPGRFKDYIAMPKFNLYQSLHTTVVGPGGKTVEVQIRTGEMHRQAEFGVAAHWTYKEGSVLKAPAATPPVDPDAENHGDWLDRIVDWQQYLTDPDDFMLNLKTDLGQDEVYVFTPEGRLITLPAGSTPVDFAYGVHTEVGHRCIGARVNGRLVPLDHVLSSGDTAEIITAKDGHRPSEDWLGFVKSRSAQSKIRSWFSRERRDDIVERGRDELERAVRRERLPAELVEGETIEEVASQMGYSCAEALVTAIGEEKVQAATVAGRLVRQLQHGSGSGGPMLASEVLGERRRPRRSDGSGVHVEGFRDELVRLARCCSPVPPDEIMGFVTRGRGIAVHRSDCTNAVSLSSHVDRVVDVEWELESRGSWEVAIEVKGLDRPRLLVDIAQVIAEAQVGVRSLQARTGDDRVTTMRFDLELGDPAHLDRLLGNLYGVDAVYDAARVQPHG